MADVLVIDDDVAVSAVIKAMLESADHRVVLCSAPAEAFARLETERFDLVISDAHFPGVRELEVPATVRRIAPAIPVIMATGGSSRADMAEAAATLGVRVMLLKPFRRQDLLDTVNRVLARGTT